MQTLGTVSALSHLEQAEAALLQFIGHMDEARKAAIDERKSLLHHLLLNDCTTDVRRRDALRGLILAVTADQETAFNDWPTTIVHLGNSYGLTGKRGEDRKSGQRSALYEDLKGGRVWMRRDGEVSPE